ncbi:MAG: tetratricopeptide repeat protein [Spirulinaceae cyanobacterium SM2_1_0]|nr:tetratricopeptide repeat protein [Spirulinaceae cyanobacterium SM2_1_0]
MGSVVEVTSTNFSTAVLQASYEQPVVVDFAATWCGPCQMLKPLLEKLVTEYDFILAKVDIDHSPDLARQYGVEGVPDVRVVQQGEVQPGFVGALAEPQLRAFLREQLQLESALDRGLREAQAAIDSGDRAAAKRRFDRLFDEFPQQAVVALAAAKFLIQIGQAADAQPLLAAIDPGDRESYARAQALQGLVELHAAAQLAPSSDLDRQFAAAAQLALAEDYAGALQGLLEIVETSRKYRDDGARKAMLALFGWLGNENALTKQYQRQLMLALY